MDARGDRVRRGGTDAFEEDYPRRGRVLDFPGITYGLYVSAAPVSDAMTLEQWTAQLAATMHRDSSCQGSPDDSDTTVDDEAASLLIYDRSDCEHDHHVVVVGVLHGGLGYNLMWLARRGEQDARRADFERMLDEFEFVR
jgi:hypothetical protein